MRMSPITIGRLVGKGSIPNVLIRDWSTINKRNPVTEAQEIASSVEIRFWLFVYTTLFLIAANVLEGRLPFESRPTPFVWLYSLNGVLIFCLLVAFVHVALKDANYSSKQGMFGYDFGEFLRLVGKGEDDLRGICLKDELKGLMGDVLKSKRNALLAAEQAFQTEDNSRVIASARKDFTEAFALACRFGLADPEVGWGPFFEDDKSHGKKPAAQAA